MMRPDEAIKNQKSAMGKKIPLYLCNRNGPCYRECYLTPDINYAVRDDEGNPIIAAYIEDPGDTWSRLKEVTE